jgi:hypothetical protein
MNLSLWSIIGREWASAGSTLRQNKHMLGASRGQGPQQKFDDKVIYFISQILGSKMHKNVGKIK